MYRIILFVTSMLLIPCFYIFRLSESGFIDMLWPRIVLTFLCVVMLVLMTIPRYTRFIQLTAMAFLFSFYAWLLYLTCLNGFDPLFLMVLFMFVFASQLTLRNMAVFLAFVFTVLLSVPLSYVLMDTPVVDRAFLIAFETGGLISFVITGSSHWSRMSELSERRRLMEEGERMRLRLHHAERIAGLGYWERNLRTGTEHWSDGHYRVLGLEPGVAVPSMENMLSRIHPADRANYAERIRQLAETGGAVDKDFRILYPDGEVRWIRSQSVTSEDREWVYGWILDITEQRKAIDRYKASLDEKDVLLKEVHHRIKNNLQVILSLLHLQTSSPSKSGYSEEGMNTLLDAETRVYSMALAHDELYKSDNLSEIDLESYLDRLVRHTLDSFGTMALKLTLNLNLERIRVRPDQAIPAGLIISELVTNALKYAFRGRNSGILDVRVARHNDSVVLSVRDDGPGLDFDAEDTNSDSLGVCLIHSLAAQLSGEVKLSRENGFQCTVTFPMKPTLRSAGESIDTARDPG